MAGTTPLHSQHERTGLTDSTNREIVCILIISVRIMLRNLQHKKRKNIASCEVIDVDHISSYDISRSPLQSQAWWKNCERETGAPWLQG